MHFLLIILIFILPVFISQVNADTTTEAIERLRPIDTQSPRALLESVDRENRLIMEMYANDDLPGIRRKIQQVIRIFDFSNTPPALISQQGPEHYWQLIDIIGRLPKLEYDAIPDIEHFRKNEKTLWKFPDTEMTIQRVANGPREGEFLISPETFKRIPEYYAKVIDFPKRPDALVQMEAYQLYRHGLGSFFPEKLIAKLPKPLRDDWLGQPGWKWPVLLIILILMILLPWLLLRVRPKKQTEPRDDELDFSITMKQLALPVYTLGAMSFLDYLVSRQIRFTGVELTVSIFAIHLISLLVLAYILHLMLSLIGEAIIKYLHAHSANFDSQLIRLAFRFLFWVITILVASIIFQRIGVPVAALAAGLGMGGLAFALATKSTLENLVAGMMIFSDKPIRVGHLCVIGDYTGTVESIGLRSTKLRTVQRSLVTIPNAEVATLILENKSARDRMLLQTVISLRYETTPDQLRYVLGRLRELFYGHPKVNEDGLRVRFIGFGACSLDIEIYIYLQAKSTPVFLEIQEDINLRIMDIVDDAGAGFAFPSQTTYLARDTAPDAERVNAAEEQVKIWRESGELPFPDLSDKTQEAISDQLDFPPKGSPGNRL